MNDSSDKILDYCVNPISKKVKLSLQTEAQLFFNQWTSSVLSNSNLLKACSEKARWHPNGFLKLVLVEADDGRRVRLHIWPERSDKLNREDIHDHYWDFSSFILAGSLSTENFYECGANEGDAYNVATLADFGGMTIGTKEYSFHASKELRLVRKNIKKIIANKVHSLECGSFHRTYNAGNEIAASLLLQSSPRKLQTRVCFPRDDPYPPPATYLRPVIQHELRELLIRLRER